MSVKSKGGNIDFGQVVRDIMGKGDVKSKEDKGGEEGY